MSDDLVKRVRILGGWDHDDRIRTQAAEIARLRAALATARNDALEKAIREVQTRAEFWLSSSNDEAKIRYDEARKIAAALGAMKDREP